MNTRGSGILLHVTSLPSPFGVGDLGPGAYRFADFLAAARQSYWQVLPLNPTEPGSGNSPYSSFSAFAGNTLLISPELLREEGFLGGDDLDRIPSFPDERCDYASVIPYKQGLLHLAYGRFKTSGSGRDAYEEFCAANNDWLEDFALYVAIRHTVHGTVWADWTQALRDRRREELDNIKRELEDEIGLEKFAQYLFFRQWHALKAYCNEKGIRLIGDIPIYVNHDSADVWTHPDIFELDREKRPLFVAGVPPDYFSKTGQLWGNPIYRWDVLEKTGYRWWLQRIRQNLELFDVMRIDHFRGFVGFWRVPAQEKTAINGSWIEAPALDFFNSLLSTFPALSLIAEDLGVITDDVKGVMKDFDFPGMRVLLFGFDADSATHPYLPHNYTVNSVVYTGTHDNNTIRGWFENDATLLEKERLFRYLGREVPVDELHGEIIRLAMMSVAQTAITPMQDILGLGKEARMNRPSTTRGNWEWRLSPDQLSQGHREFLKELTDTYGRAP